MWYMCYRLCVNIVNVIKCSQITWPCENVYTYILRTIFIKVYILMDNFVSQLFIFTVSIYVHCSFDIYYVYGNMLNTYIYIQHRTYWYIPYLELYLFIIYEHDVYMMTHGSMKCISRRIWIVEPEQSEGTTKALMIVNFIDH